MGRKRGVWWNISWNPVSGCEKVSEGCERCWARSMIRRYPDPHGFYRTSQPPTPIPFHHIQFHPERLRKPLHWKKPRRVFACDLGDLFHKDVANKWISDIWTIIANCPQHTFYLLTKRPERIYGDATLPNVWLGVSCENQRTADERIPKLLEVPAAHRFVCFEPLLGPINFFSHPEFWQCECGARGNSECRWTGRWYEHHHGYPIGHVAMTLCFDWIIIGAESGSGRRECKPEWVESIIHQCVRSGVPVWYKQGPDDTDNWCKAPVFMGRQRLERPEGG